MSSRPRKSSARVTLVLLGAAALTACGNDDETLRRDVYASKNDCVRDWGDEQKCEAKPAESSAGNGHGGGFYYFGPSYRSGQFGSSSLTRAPGTIEGARSGSHAVATTHVSRGGFGSSGSAHSTSGG
jgi:uncharacterized protein YgiB involved in biofilm formation